MIISKGRSLKIARIKTGQLQREVAEAVGITSNTYACIESGRRSAGPHIARLICDKFGATFDDLFELEEGKPA